MTNGVVLWAVPLGVVTLIGPVFAPAGTVAVIWTSEFPVNVAVTPLNRTAVAPVRYVPEITTVLPAAPLVGANEVTDGRFGVGPQFNEYGPLAPRLPSMAIR